MSKKEVYKKPTAGDIGGLVFRPYFRHHKTGKIVRRPNGGMFCFRSKKK